MKEEKAFHFSFYNALVSQKQIQGWCADCGALGARDIRVSRKRCPAIRNVQSNATLGPRSVYFF